LAKSRGGEAFDDQDPFPQTVYAIAGRSCLDADHAASKLCGYAILTLAQNLPGMVRRRTTRHSEERTRSRQPNSPNRTVLLETGKCFMSARVPESLGHPADRFCECRGKRGQDASRTGATRPVDRCLQCFEGGKLQNLCISPPSQPRYDDLVGVLGGVCGEIPRANERVSPRLLSLGDPSRR
jgi:hypothetical protein